MGIGACDCACADANGKAANIRVATMPFVIAKLRCSRTSRTDVCHGAYLALFNAQSDTRRSKYVADAVSKCAESVPAGWHHT